jgi:hypothetical protein
LRALLNVLVSHGDNGSFIEIHRFRDILRELGLRPADMPPADGPEDAIKEYCLKRAEPIFDRMPERTEEEKVRKDFSRHNIVYASDLPRSNTLLMVTAHTESEYRVRLLNPKIEDLQEGCEDLIVRITEYNRRHPQGRLQVVGLIKVFEHGLEESTISGTVVESRWEVTKRIAGRDFLIAVSGLLLFIILTGMAIFDVVPAGKVHDLLDRLSTAMFTATIVSGLTVYYAYRRLTPVIQWSTDYERRDSRGRG